MPGILRCTNLQPVLFITISYCYNTEGVHVYVYSSQFRLIIISSHLCSNWTNDIMNFWWALSWLIRTYFHFLCYCEFGIRAHDQNGIICYSSTFLIVWVWPYMVFDTDTTYLGIYIELVMLTHFNADFVWSSQENLEHFNLINWGPDLWIAVILIFYHIYHRTFKML